jgi:hypothetical protein
MLKQKKCTKCGCLKSLDDFHKNSKSSDGYKGQCKICRNESNRKHNKSKSNGKSSPKLPDEKFCSICGEFLNPKEFNSEHQIKDEFSNAIIDVCNKCFMKPDLKNEFMYPQIFVQLPAPIEIKTLLKKRKMIPFMIHCVKDTRIKHYALEICHGANLLYFGVGFDLEILSKKALNNIHMIENYDYDAWDNLNDFPLHKIE